MSITSRPNLIRLTTGDDVIAKIKDNKSRNRMVVHDPMLVHYTVATHQTSTIFLTPWQPFSASRTMPILKQSIISWTPVQLDLADYYAQVVDQYFDGSSAEDENQDDDDENSNVNVLEPVMN